MVIDTNNSYKNNGAGPASSRTGPAGSTEPRSGTPAAPASNKSEDSVVLSAQAQSLQRLQGAISELPEVDSERVSAIRQAIAEGRFEINPERIAENMLRQDELLG